MTFPADRKINCAAAFRLLVVLMFPLSFLGLWRDVCVPGGTVCGESSGNGGEFFCTLHDEFVQFSAGSTESTIKRQFRAGGNFSACGGFFRFPAAAPAFCLSVPAQVQPRSEINKYVRRLIFLQTVK
jgi:hypothetical protein